MNRPRLTPYQAVAATNRYILANQAPRKAKRAPATRGTISLLTGWFVLVGIMYLVALVLWAMLDIVVLLALSAWWGVWWLTSGRARSSIDQTENTSA
jgi:hypothetical protein